jgi:hypothetical protein
MWRSLGSIAAGLVFVCTVGLVTATTGLSAQRFGAGNRVAASGARVVSLVETGHLVLDRSMVRGSAIGERGQATGTYNAPVRVFLTIHVHYVTADVTIYPRGGSITGSAHADFRVSGSAGLFHGSLVISHGTGTFRRISGKLAFEGGINRQTFNLWVLAKGSAKY